jgi:hypothetical protein
VHVEASQGGGPWTALGAHVGVHGFERGLHDLSAYEGRPGFRFRFRLVSDDADERRGVRVDYLQVWCRTPPFRGDEYVTIDGTSFAAPHVAGTAALLLARRPWLTTAELRETILGNVEPAAALEGRTVTGGRLSAAWAVAGRPPPEEPPPVEEPPADRGTDTSVLPDRRAPACTAAPAQRQTLRSARLRGLRLTVRCDEAAGLTARLLLRRGAVRPRVGSASRTLRAPGARVLRVRLAARWARRLRAARAARFEVRVAAADSAGNRAVVARRVTLRR